jgi:hypothetical protein
MLLLRSWKLFLFRTWGCYLCSMLTKTKILCKRGWKLVFWKCHITCIDMGYHSWINCNSSVKFFLLLFSRNIECISEIHATNYVHIRGATVGALIRVELLWRSWNWRFENWGFGVRGFVYWLHSSGLMYFVSFMVQNDHIENAGNGWLCMVDQTLLSKLHWGVETGCPLSCNERA